MLSDDDDNELLSVSKPKATSFTHDPDGRIETKTASGSAETFL